MGFIAGIIRAMLSFIGLGPSAGYGGGMSGFTMIIFMPIAAAIGSFIGAAIFFVIWKLMGSQEDYETAYRCGAYLMALTPITAIIGVVPYAGGIITMAIYVFYLVMASVYVHNLPSQKAWLVFGIIGVIFAIMVISGEYKARHASSEMEKWREMGENMRKEYQGKAKDMQKSSDEMRKQAEEMAKQFKAQAEEAKRQAERNR
jgi:ATP-dependent protease ClpP protease subunit